MNLAIWCEDNEATIKDYIDNLNICTEFDGAKDQADQMKSAAKVPPTYLIDLALSYREC